MASAGGNPGRNFRAGPQGQSALKNGRDQTGLELLAAGRTLHDANQVDARGGQFSARSIRRRSVIVSSASASGRRVETVPARRRRLRQRASSAFLPATRSRIAAPPPIRRRRWAATPSRRTWPADRGSRPGLIRISPTDSSSVIAPDGQPSEPRSPRGCGRKTTLAGRLQRRAEGGLTQFQQEGCGRPNTCRRPRTRRPAGARGPTTQLASSSVTAARHCAGSAGRRGSLVAPGHLAQRAGAMQPPLVVAHADRQLELKGAPCRRAGGGVIRAAALPSPAPGFPLIAHAPVPRVRGRWSV